MKKIQVLNKENNSYYKNNPIYFDELIELLQTFSPYNRELVKRRYLLEYIKDRTEFLNRQNPTIRGRIHCIVHGVTEIPVCRTCGKNELDMHDRRPENQVPAYCSQKCRSSAKDVIERRKHTMVEKYGAEHALQVENIKRKADINRKKTCIERYGVDNVLKLEGVQKKKEKTNIEKYGVSCTLLSERTKIKTKNTCLKRYGVEHPMKNPEIYSKSRNTCIERYGDEHPARLDRFKEKIRQTNLSVYGVEWNITSDQSKSKAKQTCLSAYGTEYPMRNPDIYAKYVESLSAHYGVSHNMQVPEIRESARHRYYAAVSGEYGAPPLPIQNQEIFEQNGYRILKFDSAPELAMYIWLSNHKMQFEYQPQPGIEYEYDGKVHVYFPDFKIDGRLYEIKGDHMLLEDGTWFCPWDRSADGLYAAKGRCAIENGVTVLRERDYKKYLEYVDSEYGADYLPKFKCELAMPRKP